MCVTNTTRRPQSKQLKLDLEDEKASCELQKARVKDIVARKVSALVGDDDDDDDVRTVPTEPQSS